MNQLCGKILTWLFVAAFSAIHIGGQALHLASVADVDHHSHRCALTHVKHELATSRALDSCHWPTCVDLSSCECLHDERHSHSDCIICQFYTKGQVDTRIDVVLARTEGLPTQLPGAFRGRPALPSRAYSARAPPLAV